MSADKWCLPILLLALAPSGKAEPVSARAAVAAQAAPSGPVLTIAELSAQARQKRLAEDGKPAASGAPSGMTIVPSTAIVTAAAANGENPPVKPSKPAPPPPEMLPGLLAIVKTPAGDRYVELADAAGARKYTAGQVMPSGWTVGAIGARSVALSRPAQNKRERQITLSLSNQ